MATLNVKNLSDALYRKLGWTVRSTRATDAPHVTAAVHGDGLVALQFRRTAGGLTEEVRSPGRALPLGTMSAASGLIPNP